MSRGKELADAHWDKYINGLLKIVGDVPEGLREKYCFMYKSAMEHGYKHGKEEVNKDDE